MAADRAHTVRVPEDLWAAATAAADAAGESVAIVLRRALVEYVAAGTADGAALFKRATRVLRPDGRLDSEALGYLLGCLTYLCPAGLTAALERTERHALEAGPGGPGANGSPT